VILDRAAHERLRAEDEWRLLSAMSPDESLAVGRAPWASSIGTVSEIIPEPRGENLARLLRIRPERLASAWTDFRR
jgi:hypothetical protein